MFIESRNITRIAAALMTTAIVSSANAQSAMSQASQTSPLWNVLLPGASDIGTSHFHDMSHTYHVVLDRLPNGDSTMSDRAQVRIENRLTVHDGIPSIILVTNYSAPGRTIIDSSEVRRDGLAPIWESVQDGAKRTTYRYEGRHVHKEVMQPDSARKVIDHDFTPEMFHFSGLDEVIRSVPLRAGYHAILPLYSEGDDGMEMDSVTVEGKGTDGLWNVRFSDPVIIAHYGIDEKTHEIMRHDIDRHADRSHFKYVLEH
jgi:hypothetical protein